MALANGGRQEMAASAHSIANKHSMAGLVWLGSVRQGVVRHGMVRHGRCGLVWCVPVR